MSTRETPLGETSLQTWVAVVVIAAIGIGGSGWMLYSSVKPKSPPAATAAIAKQ